MYKGVAMSIENRKKDHIYLALDPKMQGPLTTLFEDVVLIHQALPEFSIDEADTSVEFLGFRLGLPIIINSMTGGFEMAYRINKELALVAEEYRIAIGVGSQRAMLLNPDVVHTYKVVREVARDVPVIANIGFAELRSLRIDDIEKLVASIEADALAVHLNAPQELVQKEGSKHFGSVLDVLGDLQKRIGVPIIVKEVGHGLSAEVVAKMYAAGIRYFDVSGAGGTNWISIELARADDMELAMVGEPFKTWGLPTAISIVEARDAAPDALVIGSGGVRTGVDVAKAIALGADIVGIAQPFLQAVMTEKGRTLARVLRTQLKMVMVLTGSRSVEALKQAPAVVTGRLAYWICARRLSLRNKQAYIFCRSQS